MIIEGLVKQLEGCLNSAENARGMLCYQLSQRLIDNCPSKMKKGIETGMYKLSDMELLDFANQICA